MVQSWSACLLERKVQYFEQLILVAVQQDCLTAVQVGLKCAIYGTLPALALQVLSSPAVDVPEALRIAAASVAFSTFVAAISWCVGASIHTCTYLSSSEMHPLPSPYI